MSLQFPVNQVIQNIMLCDRMLVVEADCCTDCGSVSYICTVYTVVCNCLPPLPHGLFHYCRFLLSPVLYRPLITQLLKCCGYGLSGCIWIPVSKVNFQNILYTYYHPLSALPWVVSP